MIRNNVLILVGRITHICNTLTYVTNTCSVEFFSGCALLGTLTHRTHAEPSEHSEQALYYAHDAHNVTR